MPRRRRPGLLDHAKRVILPAMARSKMSVTVIDGDDPRPEACLDFGAAVLLDKPIIIITYPGTKVPRNVRRVAICIIEGDPKDPKVSKKLHKVAEKIMKTADERLQPKCQTAPDDLDKSSNEGS